ncbi:organic cation transporter protein isoform X1 [Schistocerca nitens]|uniref:organic cation transporter protein isoform X1 n=2 Tax=Schistocerca nitens TaxID=7011 RepID=UPI0021194D24|nr:organic cation transporter protein isoform X1 [Schistocerca nitens]
MDVDNDLEQLMAHLGEFGPYQMRQFALHIMAAFTAGMHMLSLVTVAAVPDHRCAIPGVDVNGSVAPWNTSELTFHIPRGKDGLDSCRIIDHSTNQSIKCDSWVFDNTYYESSKAIEWNFVCDRRWMGAVAQSAYMFGVFTGAVVLGSLADKFGRKTIFYLSAVMQLLLGVGVAFIPEYYTFLVIRFLYGVFGSAGSYITGFVMTMEIVGPSKRTICGVTFQAMFAVGVMMVAFWGYFIKDSTLLQVVYGLHSTILIAHWWLIDESPRWLWAQGRVTEAVKIVDRGAQINSNSEKVDIAHFVSKGALSAQKQETVAYSLLDLFKTPNLRNKTLNVCLNWFANSLAYYGLSLNTGNLAGNPYLILFILGLVEIPSYIMTILLMDRTGRRSLISSLMLLGGICCIIACYIPQETATGSVSAVTVVMLGKFFIAGSFAIIYNYTAELFPTVVRNTALGVGSMCARLSGALTPLITLLDSFDKKLPSVIFATIAIASGLLSLLLPETLNKPMPQTLEDGEKFGEGDTACASCFGRSKEKYEVPLASME